MNLDSLLQGILLRLVRPFFFHDVLLLQKIKTGFKTQFFVAVLCASNLTSHPAATATKGHS